MRIVPILFLALAPLAAQNIVIQPSRAGDVTETRTIPLTSGSHLKVDNTNGAIRVEAWDRHEVHFTGDFRPGSGDEHVKVVVEPRDGGLSIRGVYPKSSGWHWFRRSPECRMTLKVPRQVAIRLDTVNGTLDLRGTEGSAELESVNGAITLEDVKGALRLETVNGGIRGRHLDAQGKSLHAESVNGGIRLEVGGLKGNLRASTVNGGITFQAKGAEQVSLKNHRVTAVFPGGGSDISLSTVNGGITLE